VSGSGADGEMERQKGGDGYRRVIWPTADRWNGA
jgi:hypothetical protein